jgi:hypothetical protein
MIIRMPLFFEDSKGKNFTLCLIGKLLISLISQESVEILEELLKLQANAFENGRVKQP